MQSREAEGKNTAQKFSGIHEDTEGNFTLLPHSTTNTFHQLNPGYNGSRQTVREKSGLKADEPQRNIMLRWVSKPEFLLLSRQTVYFPLLYSDEGMENIECITVFREHMMELSLPWLICGHTQSRPSTQRLLLLNDVPSGERHVPNPFLTHQRAQQKSYQHTSVRCKPYCTNVLISCLT